MASLLRLLLSFLATSLACVAAFKTQGEYDLVFRRLEHCPDQGKGELMFKDKLTKRSKHTYTYAEPATVPCPWDETLDVFVTVKKKVSGQWSAEVFSYNATNSCEVLKKEMPEDFKTVAKYLGGEESCPLPCGEFPETNWDVVVEKLPFKEMPYGEYCGDVSMFRHGDLLGCVRVYMDVVEKQ